MAVVFFLCVAFACAAGHAAAQPSSSRRDALCPHHANLTALRERNALIQLGDKFYYNSFQDANEGGLDFKLSWREAGEWCQQHAMELISVDSPIELSLLRSDMLLYAENLTSPVPDLYWTSGRREDGPGRMDSVDVNDRVPDRFRWTGTRDYIRDSEIFKATKPGDCVVLNAYHIYIETAGRIKKYARDCRRSSSFICELENRYCDE